MKKLTIITITFLAIGFVQNTNAQEYKTEVELLESIIGKAKKGFVSDVITIPEDSRSEFWEIYNEYEGKREELARQRVILLADYIAIYSEGSNDLEGKFMDAVFKLRRESESNLKHFYKKIAKKVSPVTAMQFFQIEDYIHTAVNFKLYDNLPFKVN